MNSPRVTSFTAGAPTFTPGTMDALLLFDQSTPRPLLDRGVEANSDYRSVLDIGAERARFEQSYAEGTASFRASRVDLARVLAGADRGPTPYTMVPAYGLRPAVLGGRAAWLRQALASGGALAPEAFPEWTEALLRLRGFLELSSNEEPQVSWEGWAADFSRAEAELHWGTTGWLDMTFYRAVNGFLDDADPPPEALAAVDLAHGFSLRDWERVARSADRLIERVAGGERWTEPSVLLDMAVVAYLRTGQPTAARHAVESLVPRTGRSSGHLRNRLLDALVAEAEAAAAG